MRTSTFIYTLNEPETGKIRYLGKSDNPHRRYKQHIKHSRKKKYHLDFWIQSLRSRGMWPVLEVIDEVPFEQWEEIEREYIRVFKAIHIPLVNICQGGEQPPYVTGRKWTEEHKRKIAKAHIGMKASSETKAKLSKLMMGHKRCVGRVVSDETRRKIGQKSKGRTFSEECKKRMSINRTGEKNHMFGKSGELSPNFGRKHSKETSMKKSKAMSMYHAMRKGQLWLSVVNQ